MIRKLKGIEANIFRISYRDDTVVFARYIYVLYPVPPTW